MSPYISLIISLLIMVAIISRLEEGDYLEIGRVDYPTALLLYEALGEPFAAKRKKKAVDTVVSLPKGHFVASGGGVPVAKEGALPGNDTLFEKAADAVGYD